MKFNFWGLIFIWLRVFPIISLAALSFSLPHSFRMKWLKSEGLRLYAESSFRQIFEFYNKDVSKSPDKNLRKANTLDKKEYTPAQIFRLFHEAPQLHIYIFMRNFMIPPFLRENQKKKKMRVELYWLITAENTKITLFRWWRFWTFSWTSSFMFNSLSFMDRFRG